MSTAVKTYDPSQVCLIAGVAILTGWNKIVVRRDEDKWTFKTGTSGESTRTKNAAKLGEIEITVPQSHSDNLILSGLEVTDALLSCAVLDKSGLSIHAMPEGTIVKTPEATYDKESTDRVWMVKGNIIDPNIIGGNN